MGRIQRTQLSVLILFGAGLWGQVPVLTIEPDQVVFRYRAEIGVSPKQMCVSLFTPGGPQAATVSLTTDTGWAFLPFNTPSIKTPVNVCIQASPQRLNAGTYQGQLKVTITGSTPATATVPVTMIVDAGAPPRLAIAPKDVTVAVGRNALPVRRSFTMRNVGGGLLSAPISFSTAPWLSTQGGFATLASGESDVIRLLVDPTGLQPGANRVTLVSQGPDGLVPINVNLNIADAGTALAPSQTGLEFVANAGGPAPEAQIVGVLSSGPAATSLSVTTDKPWLHAAVTGDSLVKVTADPAALAAGRYSGQVRVTANGAANAPQFISAGLTVLPAGPLPAGSGPAAGFWLSAAQSERTVVLNGAPDQSLDYAILAGTDEGPVWLTAQPASGTIPAGGTLNLTVREIVSDLPAGAYHGNVRVGLSNGTIRTIPVAVQTGCASNSWPGVAFLSPAQGFHATVGQAVAVRVASLNCDGSPKTDGDVGVMAGDRAVTMSLESPGIWGGTWIPTQSASTVALSALAGEQTWVDGQVAAATADVGPAAFGAQSAASQALGVAIAAGSWMSVYGAAFGSDIAVTTAVPYPTLLADVEVRLDDTAVPIYFVSPQQINLIVPRGLPTSTMHSLVVRRNGVASVPLLVPIADAAPALFTLNQQGTGQAAARIAGTAIVPQKETPAHRGQYIELYCTGLGPVTNPPADGDVATSSNLSSALLPVTLSLGGRTIPVSFAGLVPGNVALYQVNFRIPNDGPLGDAVFVTVAVKGLVSNAATIAIQ